MPEAFVRGIRDMGYRSSGDAVAELIDNALQAGADRVDVVFGYDGTSSSKKPTQIAVVDNGHGMEAAMMRIAVMWGGTHREDDRSGLGRYGYGLPCSSVSLGRRFTVISKVESGALNAVQLDVDAISAGEYTDSFGDIIVPEPHPASLPEFVKDHIARAYPEGWTSGTIVIIEKLDRLEWATTHGLRENFCRQFGVTYHKLRSVAGLYIDGEHVEPIDPLFLTPGFHLHDLDGDRAQTFEPVRVEVRNPDSGTSMGVIKLRYAWLPPSFGSIDKERVAVGLNANARFSIMRDYHGVIFSRNGRLIDVQARTPWTSFINNDRYIKMEVDFPAELDEAFGVTTSKQRVTVSPWIWDILRQAGLPKAIEQLRGKVKEMKTHRGPEALSPAQRQSRWSKPADNTAGATGAVGLISTGPDTGLSISTYQVEFERLPDRPFFRIAPRKGTTILYINTAHRFHRGIYDSQAATIESRLGLEAMLLTLADVMLEGVGEISQCGGRQLAAWSRRLDLALGKSATDPHGRDARNVGRALGPTDRA